MHTQIILSIGISLPIISLPALTSFSAGKFEKIAKKEEGFFHASIPIYFLASIYYSTFFSLFYVIKHLEILNYDNKMNPIIACIIILIISVLVYLSNK